MFICNKLLHINKTYVDRSELQHQSTTPTYFIKFYYVFIFKVGILIFSKNLIRSHKLSDSHQGTIVDDNDYWDMGLVLKTESITTGYSLIQQRSLFEVNASRQ